MSVVQAYFTTGHDGRPVGRMLVKTTRRGQAAERTEGKVMLAVAGLTPLAGRDYEVRVIRDTAPGERRGALLVEVLRDLTAEQVAAAAAQEAAQRQAQRDAVVAELASWGLAAPDDIPSINWGLWGDNGFRLAVRAVNLDRIPAIPDHIMTAAGEIRRLQLAPLPSVCPPPAPPRPWVRDADGISWENFVSGPYGLVRITALLNADGSRQVRMVPGSMVDVPSWEYEPESPDGMRGGNYGYVRRSAFRPSPGAVSLPPDIRKQLEASVPWPPGSESESYFAARASYADAEATYQAAYAHRDTAIEVQRGAISAWYVALPIGQQYLLGGTDAVISWCLAQLQPG
ncbi:MAG: hypothetical protein KGL39_20700 [Patescibacteria group bacterium]|nr:hypothetical protein [Patescibacteria group bacterium]